MRVDPERVAAIIGEIAEEIIAPKFRNLADGEVRTKTGPNDLVTDVDEAAERALKAALKDLYPGAAFIGEESAAKDASLADALLGDGPAWIVDPLDGTRNFVRGYAEFGSIIALVEKGETRMGWIYAIPCSKCAVAEKGAGASWGGEPFAPGAQKSPLLGHRSISWLPEGERERIGAALTRSFDVERGHCSAYSYLRLAKGGIDFKISSRIHPWDHLAGALLLEELGGRVEFLEGEEFRPRPPVDRALLAAAPGRDWSAIAAELRR